MRRAARVDGTQAGIVADLRRLGVQVEIIGQPVDLLVCWRGRTLLLEVKSKGGKVRTPKQKDFIAEWRGELYVVKSAEDAIKAIDGYRRAQLKS